MTTENKNSERIPILPRTLRVLVVDDQPDIRRMVELFLRKHDVDVDNASDGGEAVEAVTSGTTKYDLVFMDLHMPVLDGWEATRQIRGWEKEHGIAPIPIIAVTAHYGGTQESDCRAAGYTGFLSKPVGRNLLVEALRRHVPLRCQESVAVGIQLAMGT